MAYEITAPDGTVYQWNGQGEPSQSDIDAIVAHHGSAAPASTQPAQSPTPVFTPGGTLYMAPDAMQAAGKTLGGLGLRGGGAAAGQALGALGGPIAEATIPVGGAVGGALGELAAQMWEGKGIHPGQILAAAGLGAIPGSPLANAGLKGLGKEAAKWAAANVAAKNVASLVDEGKPASVMEDVGSAASGVLAPVVGKWLTSGKASQAIAAEQSANAVRDQTLTAARKAGFVVPPAKVNPGAGTNVLTAMAGKSAVTQAANETNQEVTNQLAAKALGLPEDTAISMDVLNNIRKKANVPYDEVAALSPEAAKNLKLLRQAKSDATLWNKHYDISKSPDSLDKARYYNGIAGLAEIELENAAVAANKPDLIAKLRDARTLIAKTHDVERALNLGTGDVEARALGTALDKGAPLSGDLETIAKFQQAFPRVMRPSGQVPEAGAHGWLELARIPVRAAMLSQFGQRMLATPNYTVPPELLATMAQQGIAAYGRTAEPPANPFVFSR